MALQDIQHFVVLMLENRSFDNMLGQLYPKSAAFEGLDGTESIPADPSDPQSPKIQVWPSRVVNPGTMSTPNPDPGESFADITQQLFGAPAPAAGSDMPLALPSASTVPAMNGFVANYALQAGNPVPDDIMHFFQPAQLPVLSGLARAFAVCDQWHASAPCQTWPNRFFVHTGTADGCVNNQPVRFPYEMHTVFQQLMDANVSANPWKVYFHDFPQSLTLSQLWLHMDRFRVFEEFARDAANGSLPTYSFIEPRYFPDLLPANDAHPPHDVTPAEQLIASVYNALRSSPCWPNSLLVVTFDEHGGCYDHVPPPPATPPDEPPSKPFAFDRYGVRVPAVLVSPWIAAGTVMREPDGVATPFDHTSIMATLGSRFGFPPLTDRVATAPTFEAVLASLPTPANDGPASIPVPVYQGSFDAMQAAKNLPMNDFQSAMHAAAGHLPDLSMAASVEDRLSAVMSRIRGLVELRDQVDRGVVGSIQTPPATTPAQALPFIQQRLRAALGRDDPQLSTP